MTTSAPVEISPCWRHFQATVKSVDRDVISVGDLFKSVGDLSINWALERQSVSEVKMGRGTPICERVCKKIVEYSLRQRQIAKALQISLSTDRKSVV